MHQGRKTVATMVRLGACAVDTGVVLLAVGCQTAISEAILDSLARRVFNAARLRSPHLTNRNDKNSCIVAF
jgi:hypothetical protein